MGRPRTPKLDRDKIGAAALDLVDQGFTLMDRELRLVACNQPFLRLLDFPPELLERLRAAREAV